MTKAWDSIMQETIVNSILSLSACGILNSLQMLPCQWWSPCGFKGREWSRRPWWWCRWWRCR